MEEGDRTQRIGGRRSGSGRRVGGGGGGQSEGVEQLEQVALVGGHVKHIPSNGGVHGQDAGQNRNLWKRSIKKWKNQTMKKDLIVVVRPAVDARRAPGKRVRHRVRHQRIFAHRDRFVLAHCALSRLGTLAKPGGKFILQRIKRENEQMVQLCQSWKMCQKYRRKYLLLAQKSPNEFFKI